MRVQKGINEENINELIGYANSDTEVLRFTSDRKRFGNKDSFDKWLKKGRSVYTLVSETGKLMGISWFGKEGKGFTLAVRVYAEARGKGLSYGFLLETMNDFMKEKEYLEAEDKDWWLETSVDNLVARKLYEKLGFTLAENAEEPGKLIYRRCHDFDFEKKC